MLILEGPNLITAEGFRVCHILISVKQANVELFLKVRVQAVAWEKKRILELLIGWNKFSTNQIRDGFRPLDKGMDPVIQTLR